MALGIRPGRCRLPYILRENNILPLDFAREIGMPKQQVSDYCNNRKVMTLRTAKNIASFFGIPIDDLYHWIDD